MKANVDKGDTSEILRTPRARKVSILCDEKAVRSLNDFTSGFEAEESKCVGEVATLEFLREMEMLSDTEGKHIFDLARIYVRE